MTKTTMVKVMAKFVGVKEVAGTKDNPLILAMLQDEDEWPEHDEVAWCSAALKFVARLLDLDRPAGLMARAWLTVGAPVASLRNARVDSDVVVLSRGAGDQPGPEVVDAPGHAGLYIAHTRSHVYLLSGNTNDSIDFAWYPVERILGIRRLS